MTFGWLSSKHKRRKIHREGAKYAKKKYIIGKKTEDTDFPGLENAPRTGKRRGQDTDVVLCTLFFVLSFLFFFCF
jgi:hypothetical protein